MPGCQIAAGAVGASEIADTAVGASEIATDAVGTSEIAPDAIGSAEIANDAYVPLLKQLQVASAPDYSVWVPRHGGPVPLGGLKISSPSIT